MVNGKTITLEEAGVYDEKRMGPGALYKLLRSLERTREFCYGHGLLERKRECPEEGCDAFQVWKLASKRLDGVRFECEGCGKTNSIRDGTWISGARLRLDTIVLLVYYWVHRMPTSYMMNNTDINTVKNLMGHAKLEHTQKYLHIIDDLNKKALDKLPKI